MDPKNASLKYGLAMEHESTGFSLMAGNFYSPYQVMPGCITRKWRWYLYYQLLISLIGYDATLEGPVFNHTSPYTIPAGDIRRVTFQHKYSIVPMRKGFYAEYFQTGLTEEFKYYVFHRTGGIQIGFGF